MPTTVDVFDGALRILTALQLIVVVPVSYACAVLAVARPPAATARPREAAARGALGAVAGYQVGAP
ncbi:hypothetical protein [Streptomyces plumbiresistens]|uniref:Uncharacterized protein n=1 Tax=Streptomyces plumbiresistens TaxID=511811 RepID=A0ABP7SCC5_9ACTN